MVVDVRGDALIIANGALNKPKPKHTLGTGLVFHGAV